MMFRAVKPTLATEMYLALSGGCAEAEVSVFGVPLSMRTRAQDEASLGLEAAATALFIAKHYPRTLVEDDKDDESNGVEEKRSTVDWDQWRGMDVFAKIPRNALPTGAFGKSCIEGPHSMCKQCDAATGYAKQCLRCNAGYELNDKPNFRCKAETSSPTSSPTSFSLCEKLTVGPGSHAKTVYLTDERLICPTVVDKSNWGHPCSCPDVFRVKQTGNEVYVERTDSPEAWNMDLYFDCCVCLDLRLASGGGTWVDSGGDGCNNYEINGWCSTEFADKFRNEYVASEACCACGGGQR